MVFLFGWFIGTDQLGLSFSVKNIISQKNEINGIDFTSVRTPGFRRPLNSVPFLPRNKWRLEFRTKMKMRNSLPALCQDKLAERLFVKTILLTV